MAKHKGGGPVNSQMGSKMPSTQGCPGVYDRNPAGLGPARSMGGGGHKIPTKFGDTTGGYGYAAPMPGPSQTAGMRSSTARPGTKQRAYGKTDE